MNAVDHLRLRPGESFALLDDCDATADQPRSRLFTGHIGTLSSRDSGGLAHMFRQMEQALRQGRFALGLFAYELGAALHGIAPHAGAAPLAQVLLFERCQRMSASQVAAWLAANGSGWAGVTGIRANITETEFHAALARIHDYIEAGDTYQVNYTYRLRCSAYGDPIALYQRLRMRQPVPYGALIALPDGRAVLSLSPELLVRHERGRMTVRPMKGTIAATGEPGQDALRAAALAADPKNRAENLMVLDLLRNDLGRIAELGSVKATELFEVKRYGNVLQMTSTVRARARAPVTLAEMFAALFPCGSITGAPKRRTMQIIRELEPDPRNLYTGAIGWFDPAAGDAAAGDFCLSVPIRTLALEAPKAGGLRAGELGVGAGIVYDSKPDEEYRECQLKARFLTGLPHQFALLETMHATHAEGCRHLERHLRRLRTSAAYFAFEYDERKIQKLLRQACAGLPRRGAHRVRLELSEDGSCKLQCAELTPLRAPVRIVPQQRPPIADSLFLRHKSTVREFYDAALRAAEAQGAFDAVFFDARNEISEGARSNVFVKLDGRWYTPPLSAGVLPGVMRKLLLEHPGWQAQERRLTLADLRSAESIVVSNALRGPLPATLDEYADAGPAGIESAPPGQVAPMKIAVASG